MHIAYICSPDRQLQLFTSLTSLFSSGTEFKKVTIFVVGRVPRSWRRIKDERIQVKQVPDIGAGFWMINKAHLCTVEDNEIIHIDTDTIILKPLNQLGLQADGDIIGRTTSYYEHPNWPKQVWQGYLSKSGATTYFPYLNTGLLIFRNGAHHKIAEPWEKITRELLDDENFPFGARSHANQLAFSLAAGKLGYSYGFLSPIEHSYGWEKAPFENSVVYHPGNPHFIDCAIKINRKTKILGKGPWEFHQFIILHYYYKQVKNRLLRGKKKTHNE